MAKALAVDLHRLARFVNTTLLILPLVFIARIQDLVDTPVGIKICVGSLDEVADFIRERKRRDRFPDYISIDAGGRGHRRGADGFHG